MLLRSTLRSSMIRTAVQPTLVRPRFLGTRSNEPPLEPGFVDKYKLNEPSRFVPIALGTGAFATATGLYVSCFSFRFVAGNAVVCLFFCGKLTNSHNNNSTLTPNRKSWVYSFYSLEWRTQREVMLLERCSMRLLMLF